MFGGFVAADDLNLGPDDDEDAEALKEAARALASQTLAEPPPGDSGSADGLQISTPSSDDERGPGLGLDPWLPRLGPVQSAAGALGLRSFYSRWIIADLSVWGEHGISRVRRTSVCSPPFHNLPQMCYC